MTRSAHARAARFCSLTALVGIAVLVAVLAHGPGPEVKSDLPAVIALAVCVFVGEIFPLHVPRGRGEEYLTFSSTFAFALLLLAGLWPVALVQSVASALPDIHARRPAWRTAFNVAQYVLALAAAEAVLDLDPSWSHAQGGGFSAGQLPLVLLAGATFWCVNIVLVGIAVALWQGATLRSYFRRDLMFSLVTGMALLGLAPVLVRWSQFCLAALPLFGLPLYAVYRGGRHAVGSEHQATHDALTGLPNRLFFHRVVVEESKRIRPGRCYAILLLDLNRFKEINDTLGHAWGDRLLVEVAARIQAVVRPEDVVARLGGDEFALLLSSVPVGDLPVQTAKRIVEALAKPVEMDKLTVQADLSIGIASSDTEHHDVEELLRRADVAMYHAKRHHLGIHVFDESDDHFHPDQLALAAELRSGIEAGELTLHYQPKLDLRTDQVRSLEALVRWEHPRLGLLQPAAFVDLAEHTGVMGSLTRAVIQTALVDCGRWRAAGLPLTVAVNVSMRSLREPRFASEIAELIDRTGAQADWLMVEITESTIMADPTTVMIVLRDLEEMGVRLSIDDFGTGYSSLSYLRRLPVSELKIDRSFVGGLGHDDGDNDAVIVRSTVELAHNLGLKVVAEGVEDRSTVDCLREMGCDEIQGYYLSRPVPADEIAVWLETRDVGPQTQLRVV